MGAISLDDILVTPLKRIPTLSGDVLHAMRCGDSGYFGFGEAYFSWVVAGAVKAWKRHMRMTLNIVVPVGKVRFVFHLPGVADTFRVEEVGQGCYYRLTVPPGIWFGFQGLATPRSLLMNLANIPHDPAEVESCAVSDIYYSW